jgi:hypothetical protein
MNVAQGHDEAKENTMNAKHAKFVVKSAVAALALAGSLAAVAPAAAHAERVPSPDTSSDSLQIACHDLQTQIDAQVKAWGAAYNAHDGAGMDAARAELTRLGNLWKGPCRDVYGNVTPRAQQIISGAQKMPPRNVGIA